MMENKLSHFFRNNNATMWIPIRLLISIAIISFFTGLIVLGSHLTTETVQYNQLNNDLNQIKLSLESLYRYGDCRSLFDPMTTSGSTRVFKLEIPPSISSVYFGKKQNESDALSSSIRMKSTKGVNTIWLDPDIQLISGLNQKDSWNLNSSNKGLSLKPGLNRFTAELVCSNEKQFILLYN